MNYIVPRSRGMFCRALKISTISVASIFVVLLLSTTTAFAQWTKMQLQATNIQAFAIDPANKNNLFAGTTCNNPTMVSGVLNCSQASGLYRSTNGGISWTQINNTSMRKGINSIAIAPDNFTSRKMFVAVENGGVFKSTDGGTNWIETPIKPSGNPSFTLRKKITRIVVTNKVGNQQAIYALVSSDAEYQGAAGIYATVNDGNTWNQIYRGADIVNFAVPKDQPGTIYVSTTLGEIRKATNVNPASTFATVNFTSITSGLPTNGVVVDFLVDPSNSNTLYASTFSSSTSGFYRSTNGGSSWTMLTTNVYSKIAVDATQTQRKYYGAKNDGVGAQNLINIYSSTNGTNWQKDDIQHTGFNNQLNVLAAANGTAYVGLDNGLYQNSTVNNGGNNGGNNGNPSALSVRLTVQATANAAPGGDITYTMTLQNLSTGSDASNFTITSSTQLPLGTTKVSDTPLNTCAIGTNRTVTCSVSQLNRGTTQTISLRVRLPATLTQNRISMLFTANVVGDANTADHSNISATTNITGGSNATAPVANPSTRTIAAGSGVGTYNFSATPVSPTDQLTYVIASGGDGTLGTIRFVSPSSTNQKESQNSAFTYIPKAGITGQDVIRFQVRDNAGRLSQISTFTFNITSPGSSPVQGGATKATTGGGGAVNPLLLVMFALMVAIRRFK